MVQQPTLPYAANALEPAISEETVNFHFGKHHMTYYKTLASMVEGKPEAQTPLEELVKNTEGKMFNQAAQIWNHAFYWRCLKSNPQKAENLPTGKISDMITKQWGSFEKFRDDFSAQCGAHFGSGWVWLVLKDGKLEIIQGHDADCPLKGNRGTPVLTCDIWEHAYYVDYRNAKPEYVKNFWHLVCWDFVNERLESGYCYEATNQ